MARLLALLGVALLLAGCSSPTTTTQGTSDAPGAVATTTTTTPAIGTLSATTPAVGAPAKISLVSASLDQATIATGEQTHLSVALANAGGAGTAALRLVIDGAPAATPTNAALQAGESATFTLPLVLHEAGTHHVGLQLNDAATAIDLVLTVSEPARFSLTNLTFSPASPELGDAVTLFVNVTNLGDKAGSVLVEVAKPAALTPAQSVSLNPGASQKLAYNMTATTGGDVPVTVTLRSATGTITGTLHVKQPNLGGGSGHVVNAARCANAATWVVDYANAGDGVARGQVVTISLTDAAGNLAHTETLPVADLAGGKSTTIPVTLHMATSCGAATNAYRVTTSVAPQYGAGMSFETRDVVI